MNEKCSLNYGKLSAVRLTVRGFHRLMKIFTAAANAEDDSVEYRLLNMTWVKVFENDKSFDISYERGDTGGDGFITYDEVAALHPELPVALESYLINQKTNNIGAADYAKILCAYHLKSYINTQEHPFPYIAASAIASTVYGTFIIDGLSFTVDEYGRLQRATNLLGVQREVDACTLTKIWPNSPATITVMENLGYTGREILAHLVNNTAPNLEQPLLPEIELS